MFRDANVRVIKCHVAFRSIQFANHPERFGLSEGEDSQLRELAHGDQYSTIQVQ